MDILQQIIAEKRMQVIAAREAISEQQLRDQAIEMRRSSKPHALLASLSKGDTINIIAEFKRRSPSKGMIRANADLGTIVSGYEKAGAAAISVLTEERNFQGSLADLRLARAMVSIPVLRKDFIFAEYQVYESAAAGADALLLIVAALDDETLGLLLRLTEAELGMDALVEVHTKVELERAVAKGAKLIGVNNRDLRTFKVSVQTSVELAEFAPHDATLISESGLTPDSVRMLKPFGYRGFLVGESLMRAADPEKELRILKGNGLVPDVQV